MKKIKAYVLGIFTALAMVMAVACGNNGNNGNNGTGSYESSGSSAPQTIQESSSTGTTQSGGQITGTSAGNKEESTGVVDRVMDDVRDTIDNGVGTVESGAVREETTSSGAR